MARQHVEVIRCGVMFCIDKALTKLILLSHFTAEEYILTHYPFPNTHTCSSVCNACEYPQSAKPFPPVNATNQRVAESKVKGHHTRNDIHTTRVWRASTAVHSCIDGGCNDRTKNNELVMNQIIWTMCLEDRPHHWRVASE